MSTTKNPLPLSDEIAAYDAMQGRLEDECFGKWVVFHHKEFISSYDSFEDALTDSVRRFDVGSFLIRLVGQEPTFVPTIFGPPDQEPRTRVQQVIDHGNEGADRDDYSDSLQRQVEAYAGMRDRLEAKYLRKWAVFFRGEFQGAFDSREDAVAAVHESSGWAPFFIWRVGLPFNQSTTIHTQLNNADG